MIKLLPENVINQIAAGEVVERPASVLKELLENSIDAGATEIKVIIKEYGLDKIQVIDNGKGIEKIDFPNVFIKHATSKISSINDLQHIVSYGFRGEALASISSVAHILMQSKAISAEVGSEVIFNHGKMSEIKPSSITQGTDIQVLGLFSSVPARKKFLKSKNTENKALLDIFHNFVLVNPHISFKLDIDNIIKNFPSEPLINRASKILKIDQENLIPLHYEGNVKVSGFAVHPKVFQRNRINQYIFVNNRPVHDNLVAKAVNDGYGTFLMKSQYPAYVLFVDLIPQEVDVNVHPRKTEVRFINSSEVFRSVYTAVNTNITNFIRSQVHEKIASNSENRVNFDTSRNRDVNTITDLSTDDFAVNEEIQDFTANSNNNLALEFEAFLNETVETSKKAKVSQKFTQKALEFSKEVIDAIPEKQETQVQPIEPQLNLDLAHSTQLLNSYIITSNYKDILIIDQHAASERYFYEKYLQSLSNNTVYSKVLLVPEIITLETFEIKILEEYAAIFKKLGFAFDLFGENEVRFSEVPDLIKVEKISSTLSRIIHDVLENQDISTIDEKIFHEVAAILACHSAVRFGDPLNKEEINQILKNLMLCKDPYNCPHGRPIIQELTMYDIEKKFKRCSI